MSRTSKKTIASPDKTVLAGPVYDALKERIMDQVSPPGSRLNIDALAAELQVSPTPVREALARLAAERLVVFEPFKGYSVSTLLSPRLVADLMHVRRLLETEAARLATARIMVPDLMAMERLITEMETGGTGSWSRGYRKFNLLDQRLHELLVSAADNPFLLDAWRSLNIHIQLGRFYQDFTDTDQCDTCAEHYALHKALSERDPEAAVRAVEAHLRATELRVFGLMETHPQYFGSPHLPGSSDGG
jgi:DNA-binding GntR family transcriptional regulator